QDEAHGDAVLGGEDLLHVVAHVGEGAVEGVRESLVAGTVHRRVAAEMGTVAGRAQRRRRPAAGAILLFEEAAAKRPVGLDQASVVPSRHDGSSRDCGLWRAARLWINRKPYFLYFVKEVSY